MRQTELPLAQREPPRLSVFDSTGKLLGDVNIPRSFGIHEIGKDYILGVAFDSLGVERLRVYRIEK